MTRKEERITPPRLCCPLASHHDLRSTRLLPVISVCSIYLFIYIGQTRAIPPCIYTVQHQALIPISWVPQSRTRPRLPLHSSKYPASPSQIQNLGSTTQNLDVVARRACCIVFHIFENLCLMQCHVLQCSVMQMAREIHSGEASQVYFTFLPSFSYLCG
jgi:hypothetical protein